MQQIAPAAALVDAHGDTLYLHGRTGMYLEPAPGETGVANILKMAREGLRRELSTALHKAAASREIVRCPNLRVKTNGDFTPTNLTVCPVSPGQLIAAKTEPPPLFLVVLDHARPGELAAEQTGPLPVDEGMNADTHIATLKRELRAKEEYLQATNEELETANEELKSSNEEMQSVNEELQSTNEELETSKEELQSVNEELATVNAELQTKVADLSRANNDMNNLLAGTGIGTVFVDHGLRILRFTPAVTRIINLIQSDIGRPVGHIASNLAGYGNLLVDTQAVLDTLAPKEMAVQTKAGEWYTMRIQPYRTLDNVIEGAVITFVDITESKRATTALKDCKSEMNAILKGMFNAYALFESVFDDGDNFISGRFSTVNEAFERMMGVTNEQVRGRTVHEIWPGTETGWIEAFGLVAVSGAASRMEKYHAPTGKQYHCHIFRPGQSRERFCAIFEDITHRPQNEKFLGTKGKTE